MAQAGCRSVPAIYEEEAMTIIDEELLDQFRRKTRCEYCKQHSRSGCDPHHYKAKGMGGGKRLDHPWNMIALCRACHSAVHDGNIPRCSLLLIIATREGAAQDAIEMELNRLIRLPRRNA
jgi:hypothetical protein